MEWRRFRYGNGKSIFSNYYIMSEILLLSLFSDIYEHCFHCSLCTPCLSYIWGSGMSSLGWVGYRNLVKGHTFWPKLQHACKSQNAPKSEDKTRPCSVFLLHCHLECMQSYPIQEDKKLHTTLEKIHQTCFSFDYDIQCR